MRDATVMNTLTEVVRELADLRKAGKIDEQEFLRLLDYVTDLAGANSQNGQEPHSASFRDDHYKDSGSEIRNLEHHSTPRVFAGRGRYGWVDINRAQELDLVGLLELGGQARRQEIIELIDHRWGSQFTPDDREILTVAREPRWEKTCHWGIYHLTQRKLIVRPQRGIQSLTEEGRREAKRLTSKYP